MSSLVARLRASNEKSPDDEKLMDLYWNRNELKKEFADLRNEKYRLQDRLKQQEGSIARLQQKFEHLEELLIDPEWARSALVFYQLRGLGLRCQRKLACFAEQLKQQREQRQRGQVISQWQERQAKDMSTAQAELTRWRESRAQLEDQLSAQQRALDNMNGVSRLLRGRSSNADMETLQSQIEHAAQQEQAALGQVQEIQQRAAPETAGLDVASKRSINFMILAFAQQLYLMFSDDELVALVKEACEKSAGSVKYGSDSDCEALLRRARRSNESMEKSGDFAEALQKRAKLISERAQFHDASDAVPAAGSVATLFAFGASGLVSEAEARILGDNYWNVAAVLSR